MTTSTAEPDANLNVQLRSNLYGWKSLRFNGIISKPIFSYVVLCICTFVQNFSVNGANNAVLSTIERVFYLNSVQSGLFLASYDLATVLSSPVIGYLGNFHSAPIFFSLNMIIVAIGNVIIGSSNFINGNNRLNVNLDMTESSLTSSSVLYSCSNNGAFNTNNSTDSTCLNAENLSSVSKNAKLLLYAGNFINGIGSVSLSTIGIVYIERIFTREKAAYCQGIYFAVGTVGGALGIVATGRFLLLYTTLTSRRYLPSWLTPSHPLWIGCWWLPYFIYASLCFTAGLFVSGLPNYGIPGQKYAPNRIRAGSPTASAQPQNNDTTGSREHSTSINLVMEPGQTTQPPNHLRSEPFTQITDKNQLEQNSLTIENNGRNGFINRAFVNDTLDNAEITSPARSPTRIASSNRIAQQPSSVESLKNMISVVFELVKNMRYVFVVIVNLLEGILLKGFVPFVTKYFEYQHQLETSMATLITGVIALLSVIIGCPLGAYFMNKYSWTPMQCARICCLVLAISSFLFLFLLFPCPELKFQSTSCTSMNAPCCSHTYRPVCDINSVHKMYLSPCHFGCTNQTTTKIDGTVLYSSCNCDNDAVLSETVCRFRRIPCVVMFAFTMLGATCLVFFTAFIQVHLLQVLLYSVALPYQNMALALRQTIVRVFGQTSGPLLFGDIFDRTCLVWLTDCYARKTCKVYNNYRMSLSMGLFGFSMRFASGVACGLVYLNWKYRHANEGESTSTTQPTSVDNSTSLERTQL